jgi:hypothetical protein
MHLSANALSTLALSVLPDLHSTAQKKHLTLELLVERERYLCIFHVSMPAEMSGSGGKRAKTLRTSGEYIICRYRSN